MPGIIDGVWSDSYTIDPALADEFNHGITPLGTVDHAGGVSFTAAAGRYHLYLARGCPFSHRVAIAQRLLKLDDYFSVTFVDDVKRDLGWQITDEVDPVFGANSLHEVMICAEGSITSKTTVPVLLDKCSRKIVSNNSADIVRMMDRIASDWQDEQSRLYPPALKKAVEGQSSWISMRVNSGVYRVLFAHDAIARREQLRALKEAMSQLDNRLERRHFLHADIITASDIWLFATLLRFDSIYSTLFGIDFTLSHFDHLLRYLNELMAMPAFSNTSCLSRIEDHYFKSLIHGPYGAVEPGKR